ncbi:MAG: MFS transporter [Microthrixaceae bacterium]
MSVTPAAASTERITWTDLRESSKGVFNPVRWASVMRAPRSSLKQLVGTGPIFPMLILFGLNAADELDRTAFGILLPNVRDAFGMSNTGILTLVGLTALGALLLQMPIAIAADKGNRVFIALAGAVVWAVFSLMTGASTAIWMLIVARTGTGIGRAVVDPTHNALLSDYYSVDRRPGVFSFHRAANVLGQFVGPILAGVLAAAFTWRTPFYVFAIPTLILVVLGTKMKEPIRGAQERRASGASEEIIETEEPAPSFAEAWRLLWKIDVLRRIWYAVPFLSVAIIGFVSLASLMYEEVYNVGTLQRGYLAACVEPFQFLGLAIGAKLGTRLFLRDPALIFKFLRGVAFSSAVLTVCFALAPTLWLSILANILLTSVLAILIPGLFSTLSLAIPARARSVGFSVASWWAIPGLLILPLIGWVSDRLGFRVGMLVLAPILLLGGLMIASGGQVVRRDINDVWAASAARSKAMLDRAAGRAKLLIVHDLNVSYAQLQVLFDINFEVAEGEIVALLGTNGAGKSTLLRAISGVTEANFGAVILDGRDITHAPPNEIAELGVAQVPGGAGIFGGMSVRENLRAASWMIRKDHQLYQSRVQEVLETFPILRERFDEPAADLSGGQQQMLALGMALLSQPKLLLIDELSLGLAPAVVAQLCSLVRSIAAAGTTVILVEQSLNVALTMASTAYFMERGRIQFSGPAHELANRPDLLRAVFLAQKEPEEKSESQAVQAQAVVVVANTSIESTRPALQLVGVTRRFGGNTAVEDVSLSVAPAEIVGLIGQNGAGKTTLFDMICGYQPLDGGHIHLDGIDVARATPYERARVGLGRTFQGGRLFPGLTVAESVAVALEGSLLVRDPLNAALALPASVESEHRADRRVRALLELFGLSAYAQSFTRELSTGTRRIVEFACAVAHQPKVLLLDEPAAGVAQREVEQLGFLLLRIREELGCALVVIEHDMPLLSSISDRLIALELGSCISEGRPDQVLSDQRVISSYLGNDSAAVARSGPQ